MTTLSPFFRARRKERSSSYTVARHFSYMYVILSLASPYNTYRKILITSHNHLTLNFHAPHLQKASRNMEEHFNYFFFLFCKNYSTTLKHYSTLDIAYIELKQRLPILYGYACLLWLVLLALLQIDLALSRSHKTTSDQVKWPKNVRFEVSLWK